MKKIRLLIGLICCLSQGIFAQSYTPQEMVNLMENGINVGNILSAPYEGDWAPALTETYIDNLYRLGFKTVRIPIRFDKQTTPFADVTYTNGSGNYIGSPDQYTVNTTYLNRINTILGWCTSRNLVAIIDVHGDHWFWGSFNPDHEEYKTGNDRLAAIDRFKAIWRDIATSFQNKPETVLFEIMNEPYFDMSASEVENINTQILTIIRQNNPTRNVIVTGGGVNSWQAPMALSDTFLQSDTHLIATFHYYIPFNFTNSSSPTQSNPDYSWGTAADKAIVDDHFSQVKTWSNQKNIPVLLGEFGADNVNGMNYTTGITGNGPDTASRLAYHQYVSQAARNRDFTLTVWDAGDQSKKTIYIQSDETWVKDIRNAVLGSTCTNQMYINNAYVECNYDYSWNVITTGSAIAKINNAKPSDAFNNTQSLEIMVQNATSYQNVILENEIFSSVPAFHFNVHFEAKAGSNTQSIKVRIKATVNGNVQYFTSPVINLTLAYLPYTYSFDLPTQTTNVKLEILCGNSMGSYFLDNFTVDTETVGVEITKMKKSTSIPIHLKRLYILTKLIS
jgi:endoglucanase